jgi:biotin carboxyl carrier protein
MSEIKVDGALWRSSLLPEGIVEHWFVRDGSQVVAGTLIVSVRIEDALHDILAPVSGALTIITKANAVIDPGSVLAEIS